VLQDLKGCVVPSSTLRRLQSKLKLLCLRFGISSPFIDNGTATTDIIRETTKSKEKTVHGICGRSFTKTIVNLVQSMDDGLERLEFGNGALQTLAELTELLDEQGLRKDDTMAND